MGSSEKAQAERTEPRTLSLSSKEGSAHAYCISSYGAYMAVCNLSPQDLREVFSNTPPYDLKRLADALQDNIDDMSADPLNNEGAIKDLSYKQALLRAMARDFEEDKQVCAVGSSDFNGALFGQE